MKARLAVLISDVPGGGLDARARALFSRLERFDTTFVCHRGRPIERIKNFYNALHNTNPALIYLIDPIYAGVTATWLYRTRPRVPFILDTGDLVYDLAREMGRLGAVSLGIVRWSEQTALRMATTIVVRGAFHREWLVERGYASVQVIPDGVALKQFFPMDASALRSQLGFKNDDLVLGIVGTINWNVRRKLCYGWDLIETLAHLRDLDVKGLVVGNGTGLDMLKSRTQELGVADRLVYSGRVPYSDLPRYINAMDICLLTQPDSPMSQVRTTGKLPLYLACDRFVIATRVGAAARVLPLQALLPYQGIGRDPDHPARLATKIRDLAQHRDMLRMDGRGIAIAREHFDYDKLARELEQILDHALLS